ncbi:MAG TPA: flavodoxin domain-containing protein [Bacillota bacterium]
MKTVVLYKSKTGFTKQYAAWIAEELSADLADSSKVKADVFQGYDTIIYGGGLYAAAINGVKLITKNLENLKGKKVVVFATGAAQYGDAVVNAILKRNFTAEQQQQLRFFYFRGGFDYNKLKPVDKLLMSMMKWYLQTKTALTADDRELLAAYEQPIDFCNRQNIKPLIDYVKSN